ncbi:alpha/beta fold hydrolase [Pseudomonas syringae pv. actinidiae]|nr:alpha/beta fold hydrolase [Pseudomonas syringae pv. actinidiae]
MRDRLFLLPGWGLGVSPLEPLAAALRGLDEHLRVEIEPLPDIDSCDVPDWLDELDANLPDDAWLGGWSLGGMLAAELAARRGEGCCGLLTLASNAVSSPRARGRMRCPRRISMRFWQVVRWIPTRRSSVSVCCAHKVQRTLAVWRACSRPARRTAPKPRWSTG